MDSLAKNETKQQQEKMVLTEVPENLRRLLLTLVKTFYGLECYIIFYYIQEKVILKEEEIRDICRIDLRQLRKFLVILKVDKFIKERLVSEEVEGKLRKFTYFFVNYKGALNVAKYKIDHIRQKLEGREKDDVNRAYYRCSNDQCKRQYDAMDMGKIFDPFTQEMRCWQCKSIVEQDESGGPSQVTRSSMAKFNEQMTGIFSLLKQMDGARFGMEITEPPIKTTQIPREGGETIELGTRKIINLGERAFTTAGKTRTDLYGGEITVSIGENLQKAPEAKAEIPWLLTSRQNLADEETHQQSASTSTFATNLFSDQQQNGELFLDEKHKMNGQEEGSLEEENEDGPAQKRPKREEIMSLLAEEADEQEEVAVESEERMEMEMQQQSSVSVNKEEDSSEMVLVQGERVHIDEIDEHKLAMMSEQEKADYYERMQNEYADLYY